MGGREGTTTPCVFQLLSISLSGCTTSHCPAHIPLASVTLLASLGSSLIGLFSWTPGHLSLGPGMDSTLPVLVSLCRAVAGSGHGRALWPDVEPRSPCGGLCAGRTPWQVASLLAASHHRSLNGAALMGLWEMVP